MLGHPGSQMRWWLLWAAIPYGMVSAFRARCYQWGWLTQRRLSVPVISIGNLTVGGTGKTPTVIKLADWLLAEGKRVAILSRGYRRTSQGKHLLVSDGERVLVGAKEAGDEPFLIATRCPKAVVAVGPDRYELGRWVLSQFPIDCVLLDDGFQHLALHRDVNLLLVDATDVNGLSAVVPAGRLREPLTAVARATVIVVTRADVASQVNQVIERLRAAVGSIPDPVRTVFRAEGLVSLQNAEVQPPLSCRGKTALLCSGIGHAASFRAIAEILGLRVLGEIGYPDHHGYNEADIIHVHAQARELKVDVIVTTEKDAGKVRPLLTQADGNWLAVRLGVDVIAGEDRLRQLVLRQPMQLRAEVCA